MDAATRVARTAAGRRGPAATMPPAVNSGNANHHAAVTGCFQGTSHGRHRVRPSKARI